MKRIYYLTSSLPSVQGISRDLHAVGIGDNRIHVTGGDVAGLQQAHVNTAGVLEETDLMHSAFVGAMYGLGAGVLVGFMLAGMDPWGRDLGTETIMGVTVFGICVGAWLGGIRGISSRNHHLEPYLARVEQGRSYLVMVDVDDERQLDAIERVMQEKHREAQQAGREEHYSPLL